jgi:hypothetical protein
MGRAGRYTLSVMAWIAAYAGWSSLVGLVIAAATGDHPRNVSLATSTLFTVVGPVVPTLVALWFNDWARDGFPTREQRKAPPPAPPPVVQDAVVQDAVDPEPEPAVDAPVPAGVVAAHPLGVPAPPVVAEPEPGGFPVAPLLRDDLGRH